MVGKGYGDCDPPMRPHCIFRKSLRHYIPFIVHNGYWKRAWILQEFVLAHEPLMMLADRLVSLPRFLRCYVRDPAKHRLITKLRRLRTNVFRQTPDLVYWHQSGILKGAIERVLDPRKHNAADQPDILEWLCGLYDMQCELAHDRVYSLLELAKHGSRIPVD